MSLITTLGPYFEKKYCKKLKSHVGITLNRKIKEIGKIKNENKMQLTMEKRIFFVKSYYETKSYNQVQTKFRTLFPERLPPNKTTIRKNVKKYERNGLSLNKNKGRPGRSIATRTQENIEAVRRVLERNQGRIRCKKKWIRNIDFIVLPNNKERLAMVPIQNDQTP